MDSDIVLESLLYAAPWFLVAALFYAFAWLKKNRGQKLSSQARQLITEDKVDEARESFLDALWNANEEPRLERQILTDLQQFYDDSDRAFRPRDYERLIIQFEQLSKKSSHKAFCELKHVQAAKSHLIEQMRQAA